MSSKEEAYQDLKQKIIQEELAPGQWIIEREVGAMYGLSRTPVREILRDLVSDGFLELQAAKGYMVHKLSIGEVVLIFQAREAVEGFAAGLACLKRDQAFLERLKTIRDELERIDIEKESTKGVAVGGELHNLIIETADNFLIHQFYKKLKNLASLTRNITKQSTSIEKQSREAHLAIIHAIEEGDENKSEQCLREHLRTTCRLILETFYKNIYP